MQFYDTATRWSTEPATENQVLVNAAAQALADGLDSASLRKLAMAPPDDRDELRDLVDVVVAEFALPSLGTIAPPVAVYDDGSEVPRRRADSIRLQVVPADTDGDFAVEVYIDGIEMTSLGAGLGLGPKDLLIPVNRLVATSEAAMVPIARCECGFYGCGATDVRIRRDGDVVHWDWFKEAPVSLGVTFDAAHYDAEVARAAADLSWETDKETAERLVLERVGVEALADSGLVAQWAAPTYDDPSVYRVGLVTADHAYQVFLHFTIEGRRLTDLVDEVVATLQQPPSTWSAQVRAIDAEYTSLPAVAGPAWAWYEPTRRGR